MASSHQLPNIPSESILNILFNLPIKLLCRFKSVSKPWLAMINHLIETRLENKSEKLIIASNTYPCSFYSLDPRSLSVPVEIKNFSECYFEILGSCNGVLLLRSSYSSLFFWNPFTQRHKLIPLPRSRLTVIQGIGYDSSRDDFKVVMAIKHIGDLERNRTRAYVFSSASSSWKSIDDFGYDGCLGAATMGVVLNGSPYWILRRFRSTNVIVYFDPCEEKFEELPIPVLGPGFRIFRLVVLRGNLCGIHEKADNSIDVWVMKDSSWSMLFAVQRWQGQFSARVLSPLFFMGEEGDLNCEVVVIQLNTRALALYHVNENRFERIELPQDCERFSAACYVETLTSP